MLDFYYIADGQPKPEYADNLEFAGELDFNVFDRLVRKGIISDDFNYYSDFRWSETLLKQIRQTIEQKQVQADTDVKKLLEVIDPALAQQTGLLAYGD
jgi:hypothetical protein